MAVRLEGRVIKTESGWGHRPIQTCYYVETFVRLHPETRPVNHRASLVQFYGKGYRRQWNEEAVSFPPVWDEVATPDYFMVEIANVQKVLNLDDAGHPFDEDDL